jgi:hypothetical protein
MHTAQRLQPRYQDTRSICGPNSISRNPKDLIAFICDRFVRRGTSIEDTRSVRYQPMRTHCNPLASTAQKHTVKQLLQRERHLTLVLQLLSLTLRERESNTINRVHAGLVISHHIGNFPDPGFVWVVRRAGSLLTLGTARLLPAVEAEVVVEAVPVLASELFGAHVGVDLDGGDFDFEHLLGLEFAFRVDESRADALHDDTDCERFLVGGACGSRPCVRLLGDGLRVGKR